MCTCQNQDALICYWSTKMDNVKIEEQQPIIIKRFERRQIKKSLALFPSFVSQSIFHLPVLRLPCVLCCAALVLSLSVALTYYICIYSVEAFAHKKQKKFPIAPQNFFFLCQNHILYFSYSYSTLLIV